MILSTPSSIRSPAVSDTVRSNLKFLVSVIDSNDRSLSSITDSENELNKNQQDPHSRLRALYPQLQALLQNIQNPFKAVGLYSRLLQLTIPEGVHVDPIFSWTTFNAKIHPILTLYLQEETPFYRMRFEAEKILDIFYKFLFCEHGGIMEANLKDGLVSNIGRWFYEEGVQKMFRKYYYTAEDFTLFLCDFMLNGLATLFLAAVNILSKKAYHSTKADIELIQLAYIRKYGLS